MSAKQEDRYIPAVGEIVWAKMRSFPPWPGKVDKPAKENKFTRQEYWIFFFGTDNYGKVADNCVWPYKQYKEKYAKGVKRKQLLEAIATADEYMKPKSGNRDVSNLQNEEAVSSDDSAVASTSSEGSVERQKIKHKKIDSSVLDSRDESSTMVVPSTSSDGAVKKSYKKKSMKRDSSVLDSDNETGVAAASTSSDVTMKSSKKKSAKKDAEEAGTSDSGATKVASHGDKKQKKIIRPMQGPSKKRTVVQKENVEEKDDTALLTNLQKNDAFDGYMKVLQAWKTKDSAEEAKGTEEEEEDLPKKKIGVLGLGLLGGEVTMRLLQSGHDVTVWNRTESKTSAYVDAGAKKATSPANLLQSCDIAIICVSTPEAVKKILFMESGLYAVADESRSVVVFTNMDLDSAINIAETTTHKGFRYLEAPVCRPNKKEPGVASLTVMASGDKGLFKDCASVFKAISRFSIFLGAIGTATKTSLLVNTFMASSVAALAEGFAIAGRLELPIREFLHVLSVSPLGSLFMLSKAEAMTNRDFSSEMPLDHMESQMRYALNLASKHCLSMPVTAITHEMFVSGKSMGHGERDMSAVYFPARY